MKRIVRLSKPAQIVVIAIALSGAMLASSVATSAAKSTTSAAKSTTTLGLPSTAGGPVGFGAVSPTEISYGGDPTSEVWRIRWRHWGAKRAIGSGQAVWVWPGWCVACGAVTLKATVVAFDLGSCGGHPAYQAVEWYFPTRGQTFSWQFASNNLCTGKSLGVPNLVKQRICSDWTLSAAGRRFRASAGAIEGYRKPPSCAALRATVTSLRIATRYRHNARWHSGSWWCGSELSMSSGGGQSFSCERGNFGYLSVTLSRKT